MARDRQYLESEWEKAWNNRTAKVMGHPNPFVTGDRSWSLGHKSSREGIVSHIPARATAASAKPSSVGVIVGNRNSKICHQPEGCLSYDKDSIKTS